MPDFLKPRTTMPLLLRMRSFGFQQFVLKAIMLLCRLLNFSRHFEQFGVPGIEALSASISVAKEKGLLVIMDVKRGDIGSTSDAYARTYLSGETKLESGLTMSSGLASLYDREFHGL